MTTSDSWVIEKLLDHFDDLTKITWVGEDPAVGKSENFLSEVVRITVKGENALGDYLVKSVFLKRKRKEDAAYDMTEDIGFFRVEQKIYENVLAKMEKLVKLEGPSENILWPKLIATDNNIIYMEDLRANGYKLIPKLIGQSNHSVLLVMESLGKFHGMSMVLVERGDLRTDWMIPHYTFRNSNFMTLLIINSINGLCKAIKDTWGPEWQCIPERLMKTFENISEKLANLWHSTKGSHDVINHGDCWPNNLMFKHCNISGIPTNLKFVDFQGTHYNSFGYDLNYYLHCTLNPQDRHVLLDQALKSYTESLENTCKMYGYKGHIYTYSEVRKAYNEVLFYGFVNALSIQPMYLSSTEEDWEYNIDLKDPLPEGSEFFKTPQVNDFMRQELTFFIDKGFL